MAQVVHISLTPAMEEYAKAKVEYSGEYLNINELVRAAILQMIRSDYQYSVASNVNRTGALTGGTNEPTLD